MADNKHIVELSVFDAGMNTRAQALMLTPGQSPDLKNVVFDDYGSIGIRHGIITHNSDPMTYNGAAQSIDAVVSYKPSTMSAMLVAVAGNSTWVLTGTATTPVSVPSSIGVWTQLVSGQRPEAAAFQDLLFLVYKNDQPYKFNGTEFTRMGVSAPTWTPSIVSDSAGDLTGEYQYVFWGVNSYGAEGDYGSPNAAVTMASANVQVYNIASAPISCGINYWKVGRNTAGASGIFWYLTDVTNGVSFFTDTTPDASLVDLAPVDQGYPRKFEFIIAYGNRVWGAIDDYLWYSNINQPEEFPSENFFRVGRGDGLVISAITPFMGMIVISKSDYAGKVALYTLTIGDSVTFADPENWYLRLVSNNSGAEAHRGVVSFDNMLTLPNRYGIQTFDGAAVGLAASESNRGAVVSEDIAKPVSDRFHINLTAYVNIPIRDASAINWNGRILFSHPKDTDNRGRNNNTLVYDFRRTSGKSSKSGAWSEFPTYGASQFVVHEGNLYGGAPSLVSDNLKAGYIYTWDRGTLFRIGNDFAGPGSLNSLPIDAYFVTAPIHGADGHEGRTKDFRWVIINERSPGDAVTVSFYVDGIAISSATLVHTESYTLNSTGRDHKIRLPAVASGKRLWIKYAWSGTNNSLDSVDSRLSRIQICYTLRGLRNA